MLKTALLMLLLMLTSLPALAKDSVNLGGWSQLPVLHAGRIKTIDSFARIHLKKFSTRERIEGKLAKEWLAQILFTPEIAALTPTFKIRNFEKYNLPKTKKNLYSFVELEPKINEKKEVIYTLLKTSPKNWTADQKELIDLYNNFSIYTQLLRSLTGILPLNIKSDKKNNYLSLKLVKNKKELSNILSLVHAGGENNIYFRILPKNWQNLNGEWASPWATINQNDIRTDNLSYLENWTNLASAYRDINQEQWDTALSSTPQTLKTTRLKAESFYNILKLLTLSGALYFISFLLVILTNFFSNRSLEKIAVTTLSIGVIANASAIILRIYILNRPPVGTLYESIIFVALICVIGCLFLEKKEKNKTGLLLGSLSGGLLLTIAHGFSGEDSMDTLVAVLNTNFWLLTHVICITIGYSTCLLASGLAHYYLILEAQKKANEKLLTQLKNAAKTILILALLFTTIGTILGGIWADQSWGRFWGWDPKENGALLIVLWLIWILHGKISKHLNETSLMVGTAFLSVIVILAWFGVNLLSVGLHSYGFISGIALSITLFCTIEFLGISSLWLLIRKRGQV